jgi:DNA-binding CsgD family transcriptional regulator
MFGTYVRKGEWLFYPFFEYYRDSDLEYSPTEFGVSGNQDYRARYRAREALFFVSYGLSEDLAVEFEVATISATFDKSGEDTSAVPRRLEEQGLGDIEGQVRWRWQREADRKPELFTYTEVVVPHHRDRPLIGTAGWEIKVGTGVTRGFGWGTLTARAAALLLLKGLSVKEIASVRATSERTIRAQSAALYSKAGLTGRAALSAFFLEDLLAPIDRDQAL